MPYWKVLKDGTPIDVLDDIVYVRIINGNRLIRSDSVSYANGILSSDQNQIWHLEGLPKFPSDSFYKNDYDTVSIEQIGEEEYLALKEALDTEYSITPEEAEEISDATADENTIEYIKEMKIAQMSKTCNEIITAGFDVVLSDGELHHFDLTTEDQLNFMSLKEMIDNGAPSAPYHASDELCVFFSAADISTIVSVGGDFKTYHVTYFNSLKAYIKSMNTLEELKAVQYGMDIPVEYQSEVLQYLISQQNESK